MPTITAYFRGRKLTGKCLRLPENYKGAVVQINNASQRQEDSLETSEPKDQAELKPLPAGQDIHVTSTFDEICIWTHAATSDSPDQYTKGVEEWLCTAERDINLGGRTGSTIKSDMAPHMTITDKLVATGKTPELDLCVDELLMLLIRHLDYRVCEPTLISNKKDWPNVSSGGETAHRT
ncbi:hypothetical protein E4U21_007530 [Claviceps maximensis]|nr:hypothetical protein E4U21_007530 [Claviceps maximensis]